MFARHGGCKCTYIQAPGLVCVLARLCRFLAARAAVAQAASADKLVITTVEFRRLWWDRRSQSNPAGCQASFWRPITPPGYALLGDVLVTGVYAPPQVRT